MSKKYPIGLKEGGEVVTIYRTPVPAGFRYRVRYQLDGSAKVESTADEAEALRMAKAVLLRLLKQPIPFAMSEDADTLRSALAVIAPFGVSLHIAVSDYAALRRRVGDVSLAEIAAVYLRHKPVKDGKDLGELVRDYLAEVEPRVSRDGFRRTRARLRRFARTFGSRKIHTIEEDELSKWMTKLGVANRSRNNERQALVTFFNWCQTKRYLPRDVTNEAALIPMLKARSTVEIYTLDDVACLLKALQAARSPLLPYTATGFFTGIRPGELARLRYEEAFRWSHGDIEVRADQAKTGQRRLVPMTENWREWMRPYRPCTGALAVADADEKLAKFAKSIGLKWPRDVMRHSYISYNVAEAEQIGKVAMWAGNSEQIIKTNYLKMVTKAEGEAFGKIMPDWPENVVHIAAA